MRAIVLVLLFVLLLWAVLIHGAVADGADGEPAKSSPPTRLAGVTTTSVALPARPMATARTAPIVVVPRLLKVIRWCEAGSYRNLPFLSTNYTAKTHGHTGSSGGYQILRSTWHTWAFASGRGLAYDAAYLAPPFVQDWVAVWGFTHNGSRPWNQSRSCWAGRA